MVPLLHGKPPCFPQLDHELMSTPFIFFSSCFFHLFFDFLGTSTPGAADLMLLCLKRRARAQDQKRRPHSCPCEDAGEKPSPEHTHTDCTGNLQLHWKHFHPCKTAGRPEIVNLWCLWDFCEGELNPLRNQCLPWHRPTNLGPRGRTVEEVPAWTAQETFSSSLRQRGCQIMVGWTNWLCAWKFRQLHSGTMVLAVEQRGDVHVPVFNLYATDPSEK